MYVIDYKHLSLILLRKSGEKGEIESAGRTHHVIENTYRKNVARPRTHHVDDNKYVIGRNPLYLAKERGLAESPG